MLHGTHNSIGDYGFCGVRLWLCDYYIDPTETEKPRLQRSQLKRNQYAMCLHAACHPLYEYCALENVLLPIDQSSCNANLVHLCCPSQYLTLDVRAWYALAKQIHRHRLPIVRRSVYFGMVS